MKANKWGWGLALWALGATGYAESVPLPELGIGTIGMTDISAADVWGKNIRADEVIRQIAMCADVRFNAKELNLLRQVLLAEAGGVAALEEAGEAYLTARLITLLRQGLFDDVLMLTDRIPERDRSPAVGRLRAEALFALGRTADICRDSVLASFEAEEAVMRVVCAAENGSAAAAALAYDVYREAGGEDYPFLNAAGDALYRSLPVILPPGKPSVWEVPMLARAFGNEVFALDLNREQLWALVARENVPHEVRLEARNRLMAEELPTPDGQVLANLIRLAEARRQVEKSLPAGWRHKQAFEADE